MTRTEKNSNTSLNKLTISQRLTFLASDSLIFGMSAAISRAVSMLSVIVLARYFSVAEYGLFDYFTVLSGVLVAIVGFGQDSATARFFYEYEDNHTRRQLLSESLTIQIFLSVILFPLIWLVKEKLWFLPKSESSEKLLLITLFAIPAIIILNFSQNLLKWTFKRRGYLLLTLGFAILQTALFLLGVTVFKLPLEQMYSLILITYGVFAVVGLCFVWEWLTVPTGFKFLRIMLPYALPYMIISSMAAFLPAFERTVVEKSFNSQYLGIYAIAGRIVLFVGLFVTAFHIAWGPFAFSLHKDKQAVINTFNPVLKAYTHLVCSIALIVSMLSPYLISIVASNKYIDGSILVFPLAIGLAIHSIGLIMELGIDLSLKSHLKIYAYIANFGISAIAIIEFVPIFGLIGVALGVLMGSVVRTLLVTWLAQRVNPLPWVYQPSIVIVCISLFFGLSSMLAASWVGFFGQALISIIGLIILQLCFWRFFLTQNERNNIASNIMQRIK